MLPPAPVSVRILVVVALLYYYRRSYTELWQARLGALAVVAVTGGLLVLVLWINLDAGWMSDRQGAGYEPRDARGQLVWWLVLLRPPARRWWCR
jgi:hypothetical protein